MRVPRVDLAKVFVYEVFQRVETGVVLLFMVCSNVLSYILSIKFGWNIAFRDLPIIETHEKLNCKTRSLLYLTKS